MLKDNFKYGVFLGEYCPSGKLYPLVQEWLDVFPVCYEDEHPHIERDVTPVFKDMQKVSSTSNKAFGFHNEAPHRLDRPEYFSLHCIEPGGDPKPLRVVHIDTILKNLTKAEIKLLETTEVFFKPGDSWGQDRMIPFPVLENGNIRYNQYSMVKLRMDQEEVLEKISDVLKNEKNQMIFELKKGEFIILDNLKTLHARDQFKVTEPKRHFKRTYYKRSL